MNNYNISTEPKKNNHFIQAAWVGKLWGINYEHKRRSFVWSLDLSSMFKNANITDWPEFNLLLENKWVNNYHKAATVFLSDNILLDNLDDDFAYDCENFLSTVIEIDTKLINYYKTTHNFSGSPFTAEEERKLFKQLVSYICLHLARNNLHVLNSYNKFDQAIKKSVNGRCILDFHLLEEERNWLNNEFSTISDDKVAHIKKLLAYYEIKNNFDLYVNKIKNFKNIKFTLNVSKKTMKIIDNNFITEVPFMSSYSLNETNKALYKDNFIICMQKDLNFNKLIAEIYGENYQDNDKFNLKLNDIINNFVVGVLSPSIKVFISKDEDIVSNAFHHYLIADEYKGYETLAIQNNFGKFVSNSLDNLKQLYEYIQTHEFNDIKEKNLLAKRILKSKKISEMLPKRLMPKLSIMKISYKLINYKLHYIYYKKYSYKFIN